MVDQFTKWVECVPLPSQNAEITAHAAVNEFFSRFWVPFEIFTDQRRNFESNVFTSIFDRLHIHKARTNPYRPSANEQVEQFNHNGCSPMFHWKTTQSMGQISSTDFGGDKVFC